MAVESKYTCDLCRDQISENGTSPRCGYGLHFGPAMSIERRNVSEVHRHICHACLAALLKEFGKDLKM